LRTNVVTDKKTHLEKIRAAWDAYHADYMEFHLKEWPKFHEHFARGGTMLDDYVVDALGDVARWRWHVAHARLST